LFGAGQAEAARVGRKYRHQRELGRRTRQGEGVKQAAQQPRPGRLPVRLVPPRIPPEDGRQPRLARAAGGCLAHDSLPWPASVLRAWPVLRRHDPRIRQPNMSNAGDKLQKWASYDR
jgi:hypothetical protein